MTPPKITYVASIAGIEFGRRDSHHPLTHAVIGTVRPDGDRIVVAWCRSWKAAQRQLNTARCGIRYSSPRLVPVTALARMGVTP